MCVRYSRVGRQLVVVDVTHIGQTMHVQIFVIVNGVVLKIGRYRTMCFGSEAALSEWTID